MTVQAPAVDGKATAAAMKALAKALGCPERDVSLVTGVVSRTKVVQVPDSLADRVEDLLGS